MLSTFDRLCVSLALVLAPAIAMSANSMDSVVVRGALAKAVAVAVVDYEKSTPEVKWEDLDVGISQGPGNFLVRVSHTNSRVKGGAVDYRIAQSNFAIIAKKRQK